MLEIPIFQDQSSDFTERVTLDEVEVSLRFAWNTKSEYWMLNAYEEIDSGFILNGIKMVLDYPILYQFPVSLPGQLIVIQLDSSLSSEITYKSFGNGHNLFYLSDEEFDSWKEYYGFQ